LDKKGENMDEEPTEASRPLEPEWHLAAVQVAHAFHSGDYVSMHIAGDLPDPCHVVDIERNLLTIEPPEFIARWYRPQPLGCPRVVTPYAYQEVFHVGEKPETVRLHHAEGVLDIPVEDPAEHPEEQVSSPPVARTTILAPAFLRPSEAIGYSDAFDFAEAFRDAIGQLPDQGAGIPDWLSAYEVVSIGAEIGGIAGFNRMYVRVRG
jgi:hypothetical protein